MQNATLPRRDFLKTSLLATASLTTLTLTGQASAAVSKPARDWDRGLKLGMASYSLRKFSLDQAISMTKAAGLKYITLKDVHLSMKSSREELQAARKKIEDAGLVLMGGGVIYINNNEAEVSRVFEYASGAGMPTIVCSPAPEALDLVEKAAKQYDIRIAIHNHGPGDNRYPSPLDVLTMVEKRDSRMGICMDVGHTVRLGQDPLAVMKKCARRLYDYHIKDVTEAAAKGTATEVGRGIIDIVGVMELLLKMKFADHVALEYEINADAPMPGIQESCGYIRGVLAAKR